MATLGERIIETFGGITATRMQEVINEASARAYEAGYSDGNDDPASGALAAGGYGYRKTSNGLRDFHKATPEQILDTVWTLWQSSPIAKRAITLKRDHIVGTGARFETNDPDLQEILDGFYDNNELGARMLEFCLQLRLLGEQIYPAFVRKTDGRVTLGYIDSSEVEQVIHHPENGMERWIVVCKAANGQEKRAYRIIREDKDYVVASKGQEPKVVQAAHPGKLVTHEQVKIQPWEEAVLKDLGCKGYSGSVFFFPINCLSNGMRGYSDLVQVADWIDQAEETLFAMAEREQMAGYFSFDVTLEGADKPQVTARSKELRANPPKKGSVNVHNDAEKWQLHAPDLKQAGTISSFVALLTFIMGGLGFPVAYYGYGDDTNRSTLQEQATPSEKTLEHDQHQFQSMMLFIAQFVADQAEIAGTYKPKKDADNTIRLPLPAVRSEDIKGIVQAFAPLIAALTQAEDNRYVGKETAARMAHKILNEMGADIETKQELENIEGEELDNEQKNNDKLNGMLKNGNQNGESQESVTYVIKNQA